MISMSTLALMVIGLRLPLGELAPAIQAGVDFHTYLQRPASRIFNLDHGGVEGGTLCVSA